MPTEASTKRTAKRKSSTLYYSTHNLTGINPKVEAFVVIDPANHSTRDGTPMADKIQEFLKRGFLKRASGKPEVGSKVDSNGKRNSKTSLSEGAESRRKK